jgi:hypothetical protein
VENLDKFNEIHEKTKSEMRQNLMKILDGIELEKREAACVSFMCDEKAHKGEFNYSANENNSQMQVKCNRAFLIHMCYLLATKQFKDIYDFIAFLLAYHQMDQTVKNINGEGISKCLTVDCKNKSDAEIELMKELFRKSPEELAKLKEQMNE